MIPHVINDAGLTFIARGRPHVVSREHIAFDQIKAALMAGTATPDDISDLRDPLEALFRKSGGRFCMEYGEFCFDGEPLSQSWVELLENSPSLDHIRILEIREGSRIRVEGDDDCPDGTYTVAGIDPNDVWSRAYVEDDEVGFYGYPKNSSIKEVIHGQHEPT